MVRQMGNKTGHASTNGKNIFIVTSVPPQTNHEAKPICTVLHLLLYSMLGNWWEHRINEIISEVPPTTHQDIIPGAVP